MLLPYVCIYVFIADYQSYHYFSITTAILLLDMVHGYDYQVFIVLIMRIISIAVVIAIVVFTVVNSISNTVCWLWQDCRFDSHQVGTWPWPGASLAQDLGEHVFAGAKCSFRLPSGRRSTNPEPPGTRAEVSRTWEGVDLADHACQPGWPEHRRPFKGKVGVRASC